MKHAKLSASGSARWLNCTGSVKAEEEFRQKGSSIFAQEGTCAHELAAICLLENTKPHDYIGKTLDDAPEIVVDSEMANYVEEYINYINSLNGEQFIEQRVDFSTWVPGGFGTSDAIVIDDSSTVMHVIDLKYGKGVEVYADNNSQGMLYALGALNDYGFIYEITSIIIHIYQPRIGNISEWEISVEDLVSWADNTVVPAANQCMTSDAPRTAGNKQCTWCAAKPTCKALKSHVERIIGSEFDDLTLPVVEKGIDLQNIMSNKKLIETWLKAIEGYIFEQLQAGIDMPGYKLVKGRSVRKWANVEDAEKALRAKRYKVSEIFTQKLISPTQAEKLLAGKYNEIEHLIVKPDGKPTLASTNDKRLDITADVKLDFDTLPNIN